MSYNGKRQKSKCRRNPPRQKTKTAAAETPCCPTNAEQPGKTGKSSSPKSSQDGNRDWIPKRRPNQLRKTVEKKAVNLDNPRKNLEWTEASRSHFPPLHSARLDPFAVPPLREKQKMRRHERCKEPHPLRPRTMRYYIMFAFIGSSTSRQEARQIRSKRKDKVRADLSGFLRSRGLI